MANMCAVDMHISCSSVADATKLYLALQTEETKARRESRRMFIGSPDRYLEVQELVLDEGMCLVDLFGEVRWSIDYREMADIVRWLTSIADITKIWCQLDEAGDHIFGEYLYVEGKLTYRYLPDEHYPEYDPDSDSWYDQLLTALEEHSVTESVSLEG